MVDSAEHNCGTGRQFLSYDRHICTTCRTIAHIRHNKLSQVPLVPVPSIPALVVPGIQEEDSVSETTSDTSSESDEPEDPHLFEHLADEGPNGQLSTAEVVIMMLDCKHIPGLKDSYQHSHRTRCPKCGTARFIEKKGRVVPRKVIYFTPIKGYLQDLYRRPDLIPYLYTDCGDHPNGHVTRSRGWKRKVLVFVSFKVLVSV